MELEKRLTLNIRHARMRNTLLAIFCLFGIGGVVYLVNNDIWLDLNGILIGGVVFGFVNILFVTFSKGLKELTISRCPKCGEVVERNKYLDSELPKFCPNCGLNTK